MGKFTKDNQPLKRGRTTGARNKTTQAIKIAYANLVHDNLDKLQEDIDSLKPRERLQFMMELSKYVVPTLKSAEVTNRTGTPEWINDLMQMEEETLLQAI